MSGRAVTMARRNHATPAARIKTKSLPPPLTKFKLFPKLPLELRRRIWADAASVPRNVDLHCSIDNFHFFSTSCIPAILHTNSESRNEGLRHYKATFGRAASSSREEKASGCSLEPRIYVNWAVDTICVMSLLDPSVRISEILGHADGEVVEKIAICMGSGIPLNEWILGVREIDLALREFPYINTIKNLVLFYNPHALTVHANLGRPDFRMKIKLGKYIYVNPEKTFTFLEFNNIIGRIDEKISKNNGWRFRDVYDDGRKCFADKGIGRGKKRKIERTMNIRLRELSLTILA
ncbi:hypothetical protein BKA65DRAFT_480887 [Rhexocercosporidium sp. MPI-PUGE-AT-0058]|nr:hypothetical protein BKA65DRAFT_480887 [Rhexocercosporidium sp. MPI-PUGE-AT-0058]